MKVSVGAPSDVRSSPAAAASPPTALTTRFLDFWLLGGASLLAWAAMILAQNFRGHAAVDRYFTGLPATTLLLALVVNYPHFLISYKLAYSRGRAFVFEHWWSLIVVPIVLAALFATAYRFYDVPVRSLPALRQARHWVLPWGVNAQVLAGPRLGDVLLTLAFNLMVFTIGWHYTKQVFGCTVVYAHFDGYPLTAAQRTLTKRALLAVWAMSFVDNNLSGTFKGFGDFSYSSLDLPDIAGPLSEAVVLVGLVLVVHRVFYVNYKVSRRLPSANMLVGFVSLYLWWLPQTRQDDFYFLLVPLFHSLQYLAFAYKVEETRLRGIGHRRMRAVALAAGAIVAGWLAFVRVPNALDTMAGSADALDVAFFAIAAMLFINIHHYFIDSVAWRLKDEPVRAYLLG